MLIAVLLAFAAVSGAQNPWPSPTMTSRPWTYWWWMGSAVDPENIARELGRYQAAGFGGVHIIPIYGAKGYESRYIEYLSPRWMEMLRFTVAEADRRGMGVDMTTGTGWCFGGPNISGDNGCGQVVFKTVEVQDGQAIPKAFDLAGAQVVTAFDGAGHTVDLTSQARSGAVVAPAGQWRVYAVSQKPCPGPVKRAAPGGRGPMLNPFYGPAIEHYLARFTAAFAGYKGPKPRAMYHDSFEYQADWSPDFFAQFERRRGYRLQDHLDLLFGNDTSDQAARVKCDYRETASDLVLESLTEPWVEWSHRQGFLTRDQAHGSPANWLDLYATADIPETEMFNLDRSILVSKFASSAAHVAGRNLVASETGTWLKEHFNERLADLKDLLDELFLSGVNHVVFHGTCYSPDDAKWPGWLFYASTEMNPRNSIWRDVPALTAYITRVESVLQLGRADSDLLLYWPIYDAWHNPEGLKMNFTVHSRKHLLEDKAFGRLAQSLLDRGFAFDYISDRQITRAATRAGAVTVPGGEYRAVLAPNCAHMPVETLRHLIELARAGAIVIFEQDLPADVPGLGALEVRRAESRRLTAGLRFQQAGDGVREARVGAGRILAGDAEAALRFAGVRRETLVDHPGFEYVRRRSGSSRYYFLNNRGTETVAGWIPLAHQGKSVLIMDPMTGQSGQAAVRAKYETSEVYIQLPAGAATILKVDATPAKAEREWRYLHSAGPPVPLEGTWQVEFVSGGPDLPAGRQIRELTSWTAFAGEPGERFAGTARYKLAFDRPGSLPGLWLLDLGTVCESARVRLNGRELGVVFQPPYRIPVSDLKTRGNLLDVEVTNLSANRIRDLDRRKVEWRVFHDINFVNLDYKPFDASGWALRDSGLLGPVTLTPARAFAPR